MSRGRRSVAVVSLVLAGLLLIVLTVRPLHVSPQNNAANSTTTGPYVAYSYTCCAASVMSTVYHPGQLIVIHWTRMSPTSSNSRATLMTLSSSLSGPYRTVTILKTDVAGPHPRAGRTRVSATTYRLMDNVVASPVSQLRIPVDAKPGFYNLTTSTGTKNLTVSGSGIIRVATLAK